MWYGKRKGEREKRGMRKGEKRRGGGEGKPIEGI